MKKLLCIFFITLLLAFNVFAQNFGGGQSREQMQELTNQDFQHTLKLLGLTEIRPGAEGMDESAPNYANYDESKANPFPNLPEILVTSDGRTVDTPEMWWNVRRPEIVELFDSEIYGRLPENIPDVTWEVVATWVDTVGATPALNKQLVGHVDNSSYPEITVDIQLSVSIPVDAMGPVPVMMEFGRAKQPPNPEAAAGGRGGFGAFGGFGGRGGGPSWQEQCLLKGWGFAGINPGSIQADNGAGLTQGIIGLCNKGQHRDVDDWGALRAWAWGAGRALDYFETDPAIDAGHVGIEGVSRYGKAAIVTLAYDQRFAAGLIASSGEGGASLYRRNWGELVENVAAPNEYHWMAGNFLKYAADPLGWDDLPIDTHMLVALCAPRITFLSASTVEAGDGWVDAQGTFMAGEAAQPVFTLLGVKDMGTSEYPATGTPLVAGHIAFRQHTDGHTAGSNWGYFIDLCAAKGWTVHPFRSSVDQPLPNAGQQVFYQKHAELLGKVKKGNVDLYLVGDSIARRWEYDFTDNWNKHFSRWNTVGFGSGMDTTRNAIYRAIYGEFDYIDPKVVAIMIGTNNIGFNPPRGDTQPLIDDTVRGITAYVNLVKRKAPNAKIILSAITPRNTNGSTAVMPIINAVNEKIAQLGDNERVFFINFNDKIAGPDGKVFDGTTTDELHLSPKGYDIWAETMNPLLTQWLEAK